MNLIKFLDYGVAALAIAALVVITSRFISFIKKQEDNFSKIIQNHLHDEAEVLSNLRESNIKMGSALDRMSAALDSLISLLGGTRTFRNKRRET